MSEVKTSLNCYKARETNYYAAIVLLIAGIYPRQRIYSPTVARTSIGCAVVFFRFLREAGDVPSALDVLK